MALTAVPDLPPCEKCGDAEPNFWSAMICECRQVPLTDAAFAKSFAQMTERRHLKAVN
jgi:hypothetical protein